MKIDIPLLHYKDKNVLPWYLRSSVGIEFGPTGCTVDDENFMCKMTGKDIVDKARISNAEYIILFCKDTEYAYYHSHYRHSPESLKGRDILQEVCEAAKGTDISVLAYAVCQYDTYILRKHPEWELIGVDGLKLGRVCLRSPGYIEYMKNVLDELMKYDIVGFHIDMMDLGFSAPYGCWCDHCKKQFKEQYGYEMPEMNFENPLWENAHEFRYTNSKDMIQQLTEHVKQKSPNLTIDFNYHGTPPFSFEVAERPVQHAQYGDFITAETLPWIFGYNNISMVAHIMKAANPNNHAQCVGSRSIYNYHEYTVRPVEDIRLRIRG